MKLYINGICTNRYKLPKLKMIISLLVEKKIRKIRK